jgi:hypothetical protein
MTPSSKVAERTHCAESLFAIQVSISLRESASRLEVLMRRGVKGVLPKVSEHLFVDELPEDHIPRHSRFPVGFPRKIGN